MSKRLIFGARMGKFLRRKIALYGAGGHAKVVADSVVRSTAMSLIGCLSDSEDDIGRSFLDLTIESASQQRLEALLESGSGLHLAIGNLAVRRKIIEKIAAIGNEWMTVIDATALISASADVKQGCFIGAGTIINAGSKLGANSIANTRVLIEHDNHIGRNVHLSPGVITGGHVTIGNNSWIGIGAVIKDRVSIGENTIIGAGAVIVKDVPSNVVAYGVPGTVKRKTS